ncbi:MAG TPA: transposase [Ktedonosporobacter sp.]|nr:transposase [Ktedonosporobacter sp.]
MASQSVGTKDPARLRGLVFEQKQLLEELALLQCHLEQLEAEMMQIIEISREGQILLSVPGIGPIQAAIILAMISNIANFSRPSQLKSYFGWAPMIKQSGYTLDRVRLSPRGIRLMKQTMYLVVWHGIRRKDCEWHRIYERLVPLKCRYDEGSHRYTGRGKVIGRIAGQVISVIYARLEKRPGNALETSSRSRASKAGPL